MEQWYDFAKGPVFRFALAVAVLGLARHVIMAIWGMAEAVHKAGDRRIPYGSVMLTTLGWLVPVAHLHRSRALYSLTSFVFHLGLVVGALTLFEHIALIRHNTGIGWPAVSRLTSDVLTGVALLSGATLLTLRTVDASTRHMSSVMDYALVALLLLTIGAGGLASRAWNPFSYAGTMFVHVMAASAVFVLMPFTKLAHCVLYPLVRLASEIGWHLRPRTGEDVLLTLQGTEDRTL